MTQYAKTWFSEAKKLKVGEALFLRVANKAEQTKLARELEKERVEYEILEVIHASQLFIIKTLKNMKQYVVIERKYRAPYTAFLKKVDGSIKKYTIDPERHRMITLMKRDEKDRTEIEDVMNGLTENEIKEFYTEEKK